MKTKIIYILTAVMTLSSCSLIRHYPVEPEYNKNWKGRSHSEIVISFGAPDRVESDGNGGSILVYEQLTTTTTTDVDTHFGNFDPDYTTKVKTHKLYTHFFIGPDNICYHVKSNKSAMDPRSRKIINTGAKVWVGTLGLSILLVPMLLAL